VVLPKKGEGATAFGDRPLRSPNVYRFIAEAVLDLDILAHASEHDPRRSPTHDEGERRRYRDSMPVRTTVSHFASLFPSE
jgi:hypothetical protein